MAVSRPNDLTSLVAGGPLPAVRKRTNVSLAAALVAEAKKLGVNVSQAAEAGLAAAIAHRRQERWLVENQAALESSSAYVEQRGLPLAKHRAFYAVANFHDCRYSAGPVYILVCCARSDRTCLYLNRFDCAARLAWANKDCRNRTFAVDGTLAPLTQICPVVTGIFSELDQLQFRQTERAN